MFFRLAAFGAVVTGIIIRQRTRRISAEKAMADKARDNDEKNGSMPLQRDGGEQDTVIDVVREVYLVYLQTLAEHVVVYNTLIFRGPSWLEFTPEIIAPYLLPILFPLSLCFFHIPFFEYVGAITLACSFTFNRWDIRRGEDDHSLGLARGMSLLVLHPTTLLSSLCYSVMRWHNNNNFSPAQAMRISRFVSFCFSGTCFLAIVYYLNKDDAAKIAAAKIARLQRWQSYTNTDRNKMLLTDTFSSFLLLLAPSTTTVTHTHTL